MPVNPTYPGVYLQEAPSSSHAIVAAPTNIAAFIGYSHPLKTDPKLFGAATQIFGFADYQRLFGGFVRSAAFARQASVQAGTQPAGDLASAVSQFFLNGGSSCCVVALDATPHQSPPAVNIGDIIFTAREMTDTVYALSIKLTPHSSTQPGPALADLVLNYGLAAGGTGTVTETYRNVSLTPKIGSPPINDPNYIENRIGTAASPVSSLVTVQVGPTAAFPAQPATATMDAFLADDAVFYSSAAFTAALVERSALDRQPTLNLLSLPGIQDQAVLTAAIGLCERKDAFLIIDPPIGDSADGLTAGFPYSIQDSVTAATMPRSENAALYFPYLLSPDPVSGATVNQATGLPSEIPPGPSVVGAISANDVSRGVWKAPAGLQVRLANTTGVVPRGAMNDARQGVLNPLRINCLRDFPANGTVIFGARTLSGTASDQWEYISVRRMALFLKQTFKANLGWVVFEPNDEPLWVAIRMTIADFMLGLFRNGAFQGTKPSDAYYVKCDAQTTTQADVDKGIVNIVVGFAPLRPAEFIVLTIAQLAGTSAAEPKPLRKIPPILRR